MHTLIHTPFDNTFIDVSTGKVILIHVDTFHIEYLDVKVSDTMYSLEVALKVLEELEKTNNDSNAS
jgi:hypothetical protein